MSRENARKSKPEKVFGTHMSVSFEQLKEFTRLVKLFGLKMEIETGTPASSIQGYRVSGPEWNLVKFQEFMRNQ